MRMKTAGLAMACVLAGTIYIYSQADQAPASVWEGVYTAEQAARGASAYTQSCSACHGSDLTGIDEASPLRGGQFTSDFDGLTVGALFDRIRTTMPQTAPGSLSPESYADILAYLLKENGFPAGSKPLDHRSAFLKAIAFQAANPHPGAAAATSAAAPAATAAAPPTPTGAQGGRARTPPADLAALDAANRASGVLSPAASDPRNAPNSQPDPYHAVTGFLQLPAGRTMGSTSGVAVDSHGNIWIADRCGVNSCGDSQLDPIMEFDANGNYIKAFGGGMFNFPHGFYIDAADHIWMTDIRAQNGKGADVIEFDANGKVLRTLGKPGVSAEGPDTFSQPTAVVVAPNGDIFVADGHEAGAGHAARMVKLDASGKFVSQWGGHGVEGGHFDAPHCLAMDREGRLYVGDRWNNRIQIFDQSGKLLGILTQFGRPSAIYIDAHDVLYASDSESRAPMGYGYHPGWKRGIRVGSVADGKVTAFLPDTFADPDKAATSGGEGVWADASGNIFSAQVQQRAIVKYVKR
jgi:mono/diheme cytochrome c family protein